MSVALAAVHALEYAGLLLALGTFVIRRLARIPPRIRWVDVPMDRALALAAVGGAGVLLLDHSWLVGLRLAAEMLAWFLCVRGIAAVAPVVVLAAAMLSLTGHASRVAPPAGAELVDALHVLSAGMWGGGIVALALQRPPDGWGSTEARLLLERFGRVAVIAFGLTALTGLLRATEELSALGQLWSTGYGVTLSIKVLLVLAMLPLALWWRRGHAVGAVDAVLAALVVAATGALAVFPAPN